MKPAKRGERVVVLPPPDGATLPFDKGKVIGFGTSGVSGHLVDLEVVRDGEVQIVSVHRELVRRYVDRRVPVRQDRMHKGEVLAVYRAKESR